MQIKQLPESIIDRKNILNNPFALEHIQSEIGIRGLKFENEYVVTSKQVATFFEVDEKTVDRYLSGAYGDELKLNGYEVLSGRRLQEFKNKFGKDINVPTKTTRLGIFNLKSFINLAMLMVESEKARVLRGLMLDIVVDVVSLKAGGSTKYINQRDESYLISLYVGENYRKNFVNALKNYVEMGNFKYAIYTNKIYKSIFKEHAQEYRAILNLTKAENVRDTMYSEILTTISMYETGLAHEMEKMYKKKGNRLTAEEVDKLFNDFENNPTWVPQIEMARMKMASRDYGLRSVVHPELTEYINPLDTSDFERFLGEKSKELAKMIEEYQEVFKRLKDK